MDDEDCRTLAMSAAYDAESVGSSERRRRAVDDFGYQDKRATIAVSNVDAQSAEAEMAELADLVVAHGGQVRAQFSYPTEGHYVGRTQTMVIEGLTASDVRKFWPA